MAYDSTDGMWEGILGVTAITASAKAKSKHRVRTCATRPHLWGPTMYPVVNAVKRGLAFRVCQRGGCKAVEWR